jgi:two-component system cell cycle sensor histidine kinase/response regulator CckA
VTKDQVDVLLVDDDDDDYLLTKDMLSGLDGTRYRIDWAADYDTALRQCRQGAYDVCLIDYRLGPEDGIQLVRELIAEGNDMPIIVLTGQGDYRVDVEAAQAGAADYLVKSEISPTLLERTIRYAIRSNADMRALRDSEKELRQAQKMEAIGQLAGGIAHDFNNLMTAVIGFSELTLAQLGATDPTRTFVNEIKRAGERAGAMTQKLLAFSRNQVFRTQVLDLNLVVGEADKLLRLLVSDDIELECVLDPELGPVSADPGQLEQVIINLAINAGDAMPAGGKLTIETRNIELEARHRSAYADLPPGPYAMLMVSDTGTGMSESTLRQIFEPFFTTKEVGKGTGLGLSTVFGIVRQSGGDVGVQSEPGHGTTFTVYLPSVPAGADEIELPVAVQPELPRGSETILLVDDEPVVRRFELEVLRELGYTVIEADDVDHALQISAEHRGPIELLLTDVVMPRVSGPQLAERLSHDRPELRPLYTSGYGPDEIVRHGMAEGDSSFLQKPLTRAALAQKVRELLDAEIA